MQTKKIKFMQYINIIIFSKITKFLWSNLVFQNIVRMLWNLLEINFISLLYVMKNINSSSTKKSN